MTRLASFLLALFAPLALAAAMLAIPADEARADSGHPGGNYPLHQAAGADGDLAAVVHLLGSAHGIDVNAASSGRPYYGYTPLHEAARYGRATIAATLIVAGAEVNAKNSDGDTPLHRAARYGRATLAAALIAAGAEVNAKGYNDNTPLRLAAGYGHATIAVMLIAAGANVNATNNFGYTPLHVVAGHDRATLAAALIAAGADVNAKGSNGRTPLLLAAIYGRTPVRSLLLAAGGHWGEACAGEAVANPLGPAVPCVCESPNLGTAANCQAPGAGSCAAFYNPPRFYDAVAGECGGRLYPCHDSAVVKADNSGCECPEGAYAHGDPSGGEWDRDCESYSRILGRCTVYGELRESIPDTAICHADHAPVAHNLGGWTVAITLNDSELVSHFIDDHGQDPDTNYELHLAAANDYHLAATALLAGGADPDLKNSAGDAPLHSATRAGLAQMVSILLAADANPDLQDRRGDGALHLALRDQADGLVSLLLAGGANPDLKNPDGDGALHLATRAGLARIVSILLAADADPDLQDRRGDGALHLALRDQADGLVSLLLAADANVNLQGDGGETPLHLETRAGRLGMVSLFLERGANPDIANAQGETPLHLAARDSAFGIAKLLLQRGANPDATDSDGDTPLHEVARLDDAADNVALVSLLLDKGANPNIGNNARWRPLDLAYGRTDSYPPRRKMMAALITGGADWASECTGGTVPNGNYQGAAEASTYPRCACPAHINQRDSFGACECPADSHAQVNGRCLAKNSAQVQLEIAKMRAELERLRLELAELNVRLSLAADGPPEMLEEVAKRAEVATRGIARLRNNFLALARAGLAAADDAGPAPALALSDTEATCRMLDGEVQTHSRSGAKICSGIDHNDTFCIVGSASAFPCVGLFRHVRRCNDDYNRPALDPWHCAKKCADGLRARGAKCEPES